MKARARRVALWGIMPKVLLGLATLLLGRIFGSVVFVIGLTVFTVMFVRQEMRKQYWIDPKAQSDRLWEDLVWGHTQWLNMVDGRLETPEEGIARLTRR